MVGRVVNTNAETMDMTYLTVGVRSVLKKPFFQDPYTGSLLRGEARLGEKRAPSDRKPLPLG